MNKPYVTCLMMTSIDGKIDGDYIEDSDYVGWFYDDYIAKVSDAFGCGSTTYKMYYSDESVDLSKYQGINVDDGDYIVKDTCNYVVSFDSTGKVYWKDKYHYYPEYVKNRILVVTTKKASKNYLAYLRSKEIPYIICGNEKVDLKIALDKLYTIFDIKRFAITGGAIINSSFLKEDLIDEIALVVAPYIDGNKGNKQIFEFDKNECLYKFKLNDVTKLKEDGLLITYVKNNL